MKTIPLFQKNFWVFLFFIFTSITFAQSNNCAATPTLTVGTTCVTTNYNVTNVSFTDSGVTESCTGTSWRDGWYTFTTGATTTQISIDGTSNRQLGLALYSGACGSLSEVTCTIPNNANASLTNITVSPNTTYRLRLMRTNNAGNNNMTGTICVYDTTPVTVCGSTTNITSCGTVINTTIAAGTGSFGTSACGFTTGGIERVFTFTPTVTGSYSIQQASSFAYIDYQFRTVASGCTSTGWTCIDDLSGASNSPLFNLTAGVQYYLLLDPESTAGGNVSFTINCPIAAPVNDNCVGAIALAVNPNLSCASVTAGTILGATDSGITGSGCFGTDDDDVWYRFVATNTTHYVNLLNVTGSATDMYHAVYSGASGCGALGAAILCSDSDSSIVNGLTIGQTYYVQVYTYTSTGGQTTNFNICIGTPPPPPSNDNCSGAISLTVNTDLSCTTTTAGSVASATDSGIAGSGCFGTDDDDVWYQFVATNTTHYVNLLNVTGSTTDMYHAVYSGASGCGSLGTALVCSDSDSSIVNGLTIGQTYYVQVYSYTSTSGQTSNFNICIGTPCNGNGPGTGTTDLGCPSVVSGGLGLNGADHNAILCTAASTCVDLEATYLDLGNTSTYRVESIPYNPPYQFTCLENPVSVDTDDVWSPVINLPFNFCFYGNTYNQCLIGSNGVITFDLGSNTAGGTCDWEFDSTNPGQLPVSGHSSLIENAIFGVFHDINPGVSGEVGWELITLNTGCRALVASWSSVPLFGDNSKIYTGMIVLYENSNVIEVYIQNKPLDPDAWNDNNAVVGIQNAAGTLAAVAPGRNALDADWTAINEAWRFIPDGTSIATLRWHEGSGTSGPVIGTTPVINVCPTATTTYTAAITYTLCNGSTLVETEETTVTINGSKVWNGSLNTDWDTANNWTPAGVPTATDCVVIPDTANDPIISGTNYNGLGLNLTVQNNAALTVTSNNDLTITEWININTTGDLILQNSASLLQINNDANQGTMHMTRTANIRKLDYVYWSSPVSNFSVNSISPGTTGNKYKWIPTIASNINGFGNWVGANENMVLGKGYIVRGPDSFTSTVTPFNAVFAGTPNNGIISTPILRGTWNGGTYSTGVSTTLGTNHDDNWNLIGNPYPSAVRAIDFLTLNTNIDGFIKIWTHGALPSSAIADPFYNNYTYNYTPGDYITYNSSGTSSGPGVFNGNIAAGQGFFVLMHHTSASASENVTFNNSMRSSTYDNSQFFRTSNENGRIWLDLVASNGTNIRNLVAYVDGASNNRDRLFDAITDEKLNFNLYSLIGDLPMTIQGRTLPFDQEDRVPMGIKVHQNGNYTIGIGAIDGFFTDSNQNIYLEDLENNIIHDLKQNPYSFSANAGNYPNRFVLRYTNETLGGDDLIADEANLWVFSNDNLTVKSTKNSIQSIRVFDVLGRHLADYPNVNSYEVPLNKIQKNNAGLIIQVTLSNGTIINKKAIY